MTKPLTRFKNLLKIDQKDITQVYLYALFNGMVNLSLPLGIQAIINLIQGGRMTTSWIILVCFVIVGVALTGIFQLLQLRIVENLAQKIFSRASFEFAYRIPRIKHSAFYNYYAPELANRFFDTMTIQKGLPKILIGFSLALFQIIAGLIVLSLYHSFFIIFSLLLVALIYIIFVLTGPRGLKTSLKESNFKYKIAFWLEEVARTKLSFKLLSGSQMHMDKSDYHVSQYLKAREEHFRVLLIQFLYMIGFKVIIAAGLLVTGSILVFRQEMNIGQFVAAEIIIILIIASVEKLIRSLDAIYDVLTALEKIGYVTDLPMDDDNGISLKEPVEQLSISLNNVSFRYPDAVQNVLDDISLDIPSGASVIVEGPSSSGKSTLLQMLAGILEPDSGIIRFNNFPFKSVDRELLRKYIGYVLNKNDIFHGTILDNISVGREAATPENIMNAIKITELDGFISSVPMGLNTVLDPEGQKIPRNIKERILLARAIATRPVLLIMESPLDHVIPSEKRKIISRLVHPDNPWSIIITSVDPIWKEYISDHIIIEKGNIIATNINSQDNAEH